MKRINWTILFLVMFLLILGALMIVLDMYHVFSRPKYTAFFEEISLSCEIEDDVCDVIAPIYTSDDYEILGWSKDIKKEQADYQINETVTLTGNTTFYVVKRKKLKAEFILQDNNLSTETEASFCYLYNDDLSCQIISPKFTGPDNYEILGWHTDKNSITALVSNNQTITIDQDIKYYSVIKKHLKATFFPILHLLYLGITINSAIL